jgi:hypothetical protein
VTVIENPSHGIPNPDDGRDGVGEKSTLAGIPICELRDAVQSDIHKMCLLGRSIQSAQKTDK